ncbi:hypothetical protein EDF37_3363 [Frondihabitans sp. PhB153]|nr:hypothetical protein EDF37_3363 [Frondihabitans sp. PhB153]
MLLCVFAQRFQVDRVLAQLTASRRLRINDAESDNLESASNRDKYVRSTRTAEKLRIGSEAVERVGNSLF